MSTRLKRILKVAALEAQAKKVCYRLKVTLVGSDPPVWRAFEITGDYMLADLHGMIQDTMGWEDAQAHEFRINGESFMDPEQVEEHDPKIFDENIMISALHLKSGQILEYEYDFDDSWVHEVVIEEIRAFGPSEEDRRVLAGEGACPPESCGGIDSYNALLAAYSSKKRADHKEAVEWFGDHFDPGIWEDKEAWLSSSDVAV